MSRSPEGVRYGSQVLRFPEHPFRLDPLVGPRRSRPASASEDDPSRLFDRPTAGPPLDDALRGKRSAVVVVSDASRSTGVERYLPALLGRIRASGVETVTIAVGGGLHRPAGAEEIERIVGRGPAAACEVVVHDPDDDDRLVALGTTEAGTPVRVHRVLVEHDAVLLTGAVGFHYYAGYSGGRKAVVPGLAARETVVGNHLRALRADGSRHPDARAGLLAGNPVHRDMVESAAFVRPTFLINTVMGEGGTIEAAFAGDWQAAHEAACRYVGETRTVEVEPRPLVVVSAGGAPHDIDLVQSHKAFEAVFPAVAEGGCVILVAACPDGFGAADFESGLAIPDEDALVAELRRDYRVYLQTALAWRRKLVHCSLVLVSGMPEAAVATTGAVAARDLSDALRKAARSVPSGAPGWVLEQGIRWLLEPRATAGEARR